MIRKRNISKTVTALLTTALLIGCQKEEVLVMPTFYDSQVDVNPIDEWIYQNYTAPYNIAVDYRWNPFEVPVFKDLVPVKEEKVIPVMTVVKQTWIEPYLSQAGEAFVKNYAPKQFVLVGSAQFNNDGTTVLGEAESGRKVTLYVINDFVNTNVPEVKQLLHTIHHEFAHILHQTVLYPQTYKSITASGYTATWYNTDVQSALDLGFITPYARFNSDEDFVEMVSVMLVKGHDGYEELIANASSEGRISIRKKEAIVVAYFQQTWNINFYELQALTEAAIAQATQG